jgi:hypothetical protein
MIYKLRVILDTEEDIFRDIAIENTDTLEDLHNAIVNAFGFDGSEMASFYTCDDKWNQDEEIPLFDTGDVMGEMRIMTDFTLENMLYEEQTKIIYVYDFFNMWTFFVELAAVETPESGETYPVLLYSHGILPDQAPDKEFDIEKEDIYADFEDFGFEENWN